jgi:hypothetical protein
MEQPLMPVAQGQYDKYHLQHEHDAQLTAQIKQRVNSPFICVIQI